MTRIYNDCTTPAAAFTILDDSLNRNLPVVEMFARVPKEEDEEQRRERKTLIDNRAAELLGTYLAVIRRLSMNKHVILSEQLEQIVRWMMTGDMTDPTVRDSIKARYGEIKASHPKPPDETSALGNDLFAQITAARVSREEAYR